MSIVNRDFHKKIVEMGIMTDPEVQSILKKNNNDHYKVLEAVRAKGALRREDLGKLWADGIGIARVDLNETLFQPEITRMLSKESAKKHVAIPLYKFGDTVTVGMKNPIDAAVVGLISREMNQPVNAVFAFADEILAAIEIQYQSVTEVENLFNELKLDLLTSATGEITRAQLEKASGQEAVIKLGESLLLLAVKERASDIHVEPTELNIRIRFRIDGILHERLTLDKNLLPPLVSRFKVMANLDITQRRVPMDGRISLQLPGKSIDFRLSTVPTLYGEKLVLRVLGQLFTASIPYLEEIALSPPIYSQVKRVLGVTNGVFFVTGPTGSGKTTTLFSVLKQLNTQGVNVMTIEDPVEYRLPGVNQVQINHEAGLDFATSLRSLMRQDPDIILVGEIRDKETARIASQAALTGHLVLATMHTNNALQAVTRLVEIGVEPFLVAPSIIGVMGQRLVRRICRNCKEEYKPDSGYMEQYFTNTDGVDLRLYRGKGCEQCNGIGYRGRIGIHEMLIINEEMRGHIALKSGILELTAAAERAGYVPLRHDGLKKALMGETTIEEVNRVSLQEE